MRVIQASDTNAVERLLARDATRRPAVIARATRIVRDVRRHGDQALRDWTRQLDGWHGRLDVTPRELRRGWRDTPPEVRAAIRVAIRHVERVAAPQVPRRSVVCVRPGVTIEQRVQPLGHVGCYVPGGRHALASTLVMTVVPARVAGVDEITVMCPSPSPAVCCAALDAGATRVLRIGGAQAIAALAYGTRTIARADKIVGPGNAWVAAAKAIIARDCAVDFHAGPSEIVVWSDAGPAEWIAADLIAQAEHDRDARAICVTTRAGLARSVAGLVDRLAPSDGPARASLRRNGAIVVARSRREAAALITRIAPEHAVCDTARDAAAITAGTVFVGRWSAQAAGDYATGSNHVLPTGGAARFRGGLSAADFVRTFTVQRLSESGLRAIGPSVIALAEAEGLAALAYSFGCGLTADGRRQPAARRRS